ncbi:MAG: winged helix-turn-helix domain-containing protein [Pseudomonadota bacterium]
MTTPNNNQDFLLGDFKVIPDQSVITELATPTDEVRLEPKVMAVLVYLSQRPGQVISRDELRDEVWVDVVVSDETITRCISELRQVLGDSTKEPTYIQTIPKKGYRLLLAPVSVEDQATSAAPRPRRFSAQSGLLAGVGVALSLIALLVLIPKQDSPGQETLNKSQRLPAVAVLPFANISGMADNEYFSDGLTEELLSTLAQGGAIRVIGRTSSFQFKGEHGDLRVIGSKLNATHILEGSVRRSDNRVRITAQLVDAQTGLNVWSDSFDRTLEDMFAIQGEISQAIATALEVELAENGGPHQTNNPEAYDLYLRGLRAQRLPGPESLRTALGYLQRSVEIDPMLAEGWQTLARTYAGMTAALLLPRNEGVSLARQSIDKALALDPKMAAAYNTLGMIYSNFDLDRDRAEAAYLRALEIEPHNADALNGASLLAAGIGQHEQALEYNRLSLANDPFHLGALHNRGFIYYLGRDYAAAEQAIQQAREFAGGAYVYGGTVLSLILIAQGRAEEALAAATVEPGAPWSLAAQTLAYHALGRHEASDQALAQLIDGYADRIAAPISGCYAFRGELDQAFIWLDRAYAQGDPQLLVSAVHPINDNLRSHPKWDAFLSKLNLLPQALPK